MGLLGWHLWAEGRVKINKRTAAVVLSSINEEYLDGPESWPELSIVPLGFQEVSEA